MWTIVWQDRHGFDNFNRIHTMLEVSQFLDRLIGEQEVKHDNIHVFPPRTEVDNLERLIQFQFQS